MRPLMSKLSRNVTSAAWLSISDSTGNETTEWVYLTSQWLAARFPEYTVRYHLWDTGGDTDYATATTIQTGTGTGNSGGPWVLDVWNAAVAGTNTGYFQGTRFDAAIRKDADLVTISHMHNQGGPVTDSATVMQQRRNQYLAFVDEVSQSNPLAGVVCILQNPKVDYSSGAPTHPFEWQPQRALLVAQAAQWRGWGTIDVLQAFLDYGASWGTDLLVADGVHPNSTGQALWTSMVTAALDRASKVSVATQPTVAIPPGRQIITNAEFSTWTGSAPDGVTMSTSPACTASKELTDFETGSQAMLLTADSASGQPYAEWTGTATALGIKGLLANRTWTAMIRIKTPASNTSTVRITLQDNNGSGQSCITDVDATTRDRYHWVYVTKTFASNATSISLRVSPRSSGTAVVTCLVDRVYLIPGAIPAPTGGISPQVQNGPSTVTLGSNEVQTNAEANMNRLYCDGNTYMSNNTQVAVFAYFRAKQTITIANLQAVTGSTAAAATPTTVKLGVYSVDESTGDLTRLGVTANDTALFATTYTEYTKALGASVALTEGQLYAYAVLQVSSGAVATLVGKGPAGFANQHFRQPRLSGLITGQTDLLSSYLGSAVNAKSGVPYLCGTT